jgi:hypothetical protein
VFPARYELNSYILFRRNSLLSLSLSLKSLLNYWSSETTSSARLVRDWLHFRISILKHEN